MTAHYWREVGRELAARYSANAETYATVGIESAAAYRRQFVRVAGIGPRARRYIREGFGDGGHHA